MKALKIAGAAVAAVIVVAGLVLVIGIPSGFMTQAIQARVERATGYRLTIAGATRIGLWPTLNVTLNDVTLEDPRDRDTASHLNIGSVQADITLGSLWSGRPHINQLVVSHPVLSVPLLRERIAQATTPAKANASPTASSSSAADEAPTIGRVTITDGAMVFSNLRDRVEKRIEGINAEALIGPDRTIKITGSARSGAHPLKFNIKATTPAAPIGRQTIPVELRFEAPGLLQKPLTARAEVRLNGSVVMINGVSGTLGDGAFNGWASVDIASKPLVKLDLDFQRLDVAASGAQLATASQTSVSQPSISQPWSNALIDLIGLNYVDMQARISAAELSIGGIKVAPVAIEAGLASGILKCRFANFGAYGGQGNGDLIVDASAANPNYTLRGDLAGIHALPLLQSAVGFDKLDGLLQAKLALRSSGASQRAIMSNLDGTVFAVFQNGAIRGINVARMIRSLTASILSGWQESQEQATDLTQLSASFRIEKGVATTTDLNLVGPLVRVTGGGSINLGEQSLAFRVEPKLVMTTQGQGRTTDPVGLGIPVVIDGPWAEPRIYPDIAGILDNPEAAYAKLKDMGKGLFGSNGALGNALGGNLGGLLGDGGQPGAGNPGGNGSSGTPNSDSVGGNLGATIGNLIQQGMRRSRNLSPSPAPAPTTSQASPVAPPTPTDAPPQATPDSQPMNDVLRQLFNR
jgi:AsmA protein